MSNRIFFCGKKNKPNCLIESTKDNHISELDLKQKGLDKEPIKFVISGIYHNFIVTEDDQIYTYGGNHFGQLGLGDTNDRTDLTLLDHAELKQKKILEISGRACFVGIATDQSEIYLFGLNNFGQLGSGETKNLNQPTKINIPALEFESFEKLCCAGVHTIIVTKTNDIYVCGYNTYGQLGIDSKEDQYSPVKLVAFKEQGKRVKDVTCGDYHSIFHTENGELWSCGKNSQGQLGLGDTNPRTLPQKIDFFTGKNITQVSCGENHSIVVVNNKEVFGFGTNTRGQLGLRDTKTHVKEPTRIELPSLEDIKILKCGRNFTVLVTVANEIIVFGDNNSCQLGLPNTDLGITFIKNPQILPFKERGMMAIKAVSCGEYHCMFLCSDILKPQESAIIDTLKAMLNYTPEQERFFEGTVQCTDSTVHVFLGLVRLRYPQLFEENSQTTKINISSGLFKTILSYIYTEDISNYDTNLSDLIELFARAKELQLPNHLTQQLKQRLGKLCTEETAVNMLIEIFKYKDHHISDLRQHLLVYVKEKSNVDCSQLANYQKLFENQQIVQEIFKIPLNSISQMTQDIGKKDPLPSTIHKHLEQLYEEGKGNLKLWLDSDHTQFVNVHKSLLAFRINLFMEQFTSDMLDADLNELDLVLDKNLTDDETSVKVMKDVLRYVYTSTLEVEHPMHLIRIWDALDMPITAEIYSKAMKSLVKSMNADNCLDVLRVIINCPGAQQFPYIEEVALKTGAKYWQELNKKHGYHIMEELTYAQYIKINRCYMTHYGMKETTSQSDPASANTDSSSANVVY